MNNFFKCECSKYSNEKTETVKRDLKKKNKTKGKTKKLSRTKCFQELHFKHTYLIGE